MEVKLDDGAIASSGNPELQMHQDILSPFTVPKPQDRNKMDLQKMLIDERIRCDAHKTNYQVLKEEHKLLQEDFLKLQQQHNKTKINGAESNENLQDLVHDLRSQLASKSRELEEVRSQGLNPQKLELIKAEITKDLEGPMKEHIREMDSEVEKYRSNYNKLRYDYEFLKSEMEHTKANHKRILDEIVLRHQTQISALEQEKDQLIKQQNDTQPHVDAHKIQNLQRQKTQLEQKIRNLLEENTEIRKQKDTLATEADSIQRTQAKDIAQLQGNLKSAESEKRSAEVQCERLQKELQSNSEHNTRLTQQIQDLNKECSSLKNMADDETHKHKMLVTNHKMEIMRITGDLGREKDELLSKARRLETEIELLKTSAEEHVRQMEDSEREFSQALKNAREEEWKKNHDLQTEKMELEARCNKMEQTLSEEKADRLVEREQMDEKIRMLETNENQLHSEIVQLRSQIDTESKVSRLLEKEQKDNMNLRQKLHDKDLEVQTINLSKNQLLQDISRAREMIKTTKQEAEDAARRAKKAEDMAEKTVEDQRVYTLEERHRLQSRITELEHKIKRMGEENAKKEQNNNKKKNMLAQKLRSNRSKLQLMEAEKERLEIELKAGRHGVSMDEHHRLRRKLIGLNNRLREFQRIIGMSDHAHLLTDHTINPMTSTLAPVQPYIDQTVFRNKFYGSQVEVPEKDLSDIFKRIEDVAEQQKAQQEELDTVNKPAAVAPMKENIEPDNNSTGNKYSYSSDSFESEKSDR